MEIIESRKFCYLSVHGQTFKLIDAKNFTPNSYNYCEIIGTILNFQIWL